MSNRKHPKNRKLLREEALNARQVDIPKEEKVVEKTVPAVIHWGNVNGVDREDSETIGEALIYADGTQDIILWGDISEDAKKLMGMFDTLQHFSIAQEN